MDLPPSGLNEELAKYRDYLSLLARLHTDDSVMPRNRKAWASWNQWDRPGQDEGPDRPGRDWHEEGRARRGRGEREWGEWAGWTGWGGWPGAAGQHGWADPEAYRDLERLAKQFSRELRSAAWHAQAVSEDALRDLRGILDETIDRIKDEVFKGKTPPSDPGDDTPPAD